MDGLVAVALALGGGGGGGGGRGGDSGGECGGCVVGRLGGDEGDALLLHEIGRRLRRPPLQDLPNSARDGRGLGGSWVSFESP